MSNIPQNLKPGGLFSNFKGVTSPFKILDWEVIFKFQGSNFTSHLKFLTRRLLSNSRREGVYFPFDFSDREVTFKFQGGGYFPPLHLLFLPRAARRLSFNGVSAPTRPTTSTVLACSIISVLGKFSVGSTSK